MQVPNPPEPKKKLINHTMDHYGISMPGEDSSKPSSYQMYLEACQTYKVKPNSSFVEDLPRAPGVYTLKELNCLNNYLGDHGLLAMMPVIRVNVGLLRLRLPNNGLRNESVLILLKEIERHDQLLSIDLSDNKALSLEVGTRMLKYVKTHSKVQRVILQGTCVSSKVQKDIEDTCRENRRANAQLNEEALKQRKRFSRKQFLDVKRLFDTYDTDRSGKLDIKELRIRSNSYVEETFEDGVTLSVLLETLDTTGDGKVSIMEFFQKCFPSMTQEEIIFCIQCYSEYEMVPLKLPPTLTAEQLRDVQVVFKKYDKNGDGFVDFSEFKQSFSRTDPLVLKEVFAGALPDAEGRLTLETFVTIMNDYLNA